MKGMRPLTRLQVKQLLNTVNSVREKALLTLGFCTGYRISELLSLKIKDICTGKNIHSYVMVKASNTKTKEGRSFKLNSDAIKSLAILVDYLKAKGLNDSTPLFVSRKHNSDGSNRAITARQAWFILKSLFAAIGEYGNVATHTMRKTFAARTYELTKKIELVQQALGHKSINSTISYLSFSMVEIENIIEDLI